MVGEGSSEELTVVEQEVKEELKEEREEEGGYEEEEERGQPQLSKKERKRLASMERYLELRKKRRKEEKEKKKEKRAAIKAAGLGETLKKRRKPPKMADSTCKLRLVVDMSWDSLMVDRDRRRLISQLSFCYSANRKMESPTQFHVVGFNGESRELFDANGTYSNWDVHLHREPLGEVFPASEIIYLSAESDNVLTTLDDSKAYVIGGLVDHNAHKGVCFASAKQRGWGHARLPIDEFVKLQSRRVLTVNHVFEIMAAFWESRDWEKAFFSIIPKRKGAEKLLREDEEEGVHEEENNGKEEEDIGNEEQKRTEEISVIV